MRGAAIPDFAALIRATGLSHAFAKTNPTKWEQPKSVPKRAAKGQKRSCSRLILLAKNCENSRALVKVAALVQSKVAKTRQMLTRELPRRTRRGQRCLSACNSGGTPPA